MASLDISNLSKFFGRLQALHDINLSIADGAFLVLLGLTGRPPCAAWQS